MTTPPCFTPGAQRRLLAAQTPLLSAVCCAAIFLFGFLDAPVTAAEKTSWHYELLPDSYLVDDCPVCGRPTIMEPLRGSFELELVEENPFFSRYAIRNIAFTAGFNPDRIHTISGQGTYAMGGEVALLQEMSMEVSIENDSGKTLAYLTNVSPLVEQRWPMINIDLLQTNGTIAQVYQFHILAAPIRELWFSTVSGLTPTIWTPPTNHVSGGDLLSSKGYVVQSNRELTRNLGIMPLVPDLGLDAVDLLTGGEVAFSLEVDAFSETLGPLQHGDLLSSEGRILHSNQELIAAFNPPPSLAADVGLDGAQIQEGGEVYFSVENEFFSQALNRQIHKGDLLSNRGFVVRNNQELVLRFKPLDAQKDFGLDAFYVWPSGEIWFSTESGFQNQQFTSYGPGDLLSDQGYVVFRNLELVGPFQPAEDLADFGLDALLVFTDSAPPALAPAFAHILYRPSSDGIDLEWEGKGRAWQVLRALQVDGPYQSISPILRTRSWQDSRQERPQSYYRLRQW